MFCAELEDAPAQSCDAAPSAAQRQSDTSELGLVKRRKIVGANLKPFPCSQCSAAEFETPGYLLAHERRTHSRECRCQSCNIRHSAASRIKSKTWPVTKDVGRTTPGVCQTMFAWFAIGVSACSRKCASTNVMSMASRSCVRSVAWRSERRGKPKGMTACTATGNRTVAKCVRSGSGGTPN